MLMKILKKARHVKLIRQAFIKKSMQISPLFRQIHKHAININMAHVNEIFANPRQTMSTRRPLPSRANIGYYYKLYYDYTETVTITRTPKQTTARLLQVPYTWSVTIKHFNIGQL